MLLMLRSSEGLHEEEIVSLTWPPPPLSSPTYDLGCKASSPQEVSSLQPPTHMELCIPAAKAL